MGDRGKGWRVMIREMRLGRLAKGQATVKNPRVFNRGKQG